MRPTRLPLDGISSTSTPARSILRSSAGARIGALTAVVLSLTSSCARDAPPDQESPVIETSQWVEAPDAAGAILAPAWFARAPDDLALDFVHHGELDGETPEGPCVVLFDANNDARLDIYFTNGAASEAQGATTGPLGRLYIMEHERFVDRTVDAGLALTSLAGHALAARAVDYDGDGDWDLLLSYPGNDVLMRNDGGRFTDVTAQAGAAREMLNEFDEAVSESSAAEPSLVGLAPAPGSPLSFARASLDANLDGHADLLTLDGALVPEPVSDSGRQSPRLYLGSGTRGEYFDASASSGPVFATPIAGRSLALGDLDGDLDVDVIVTEDGSPAQVWLNQNPSGHRPLRLVLLSKAPNTYALGAQVKLTGGQKVVARGVRLGGRYLSQNEHTLTFGLGAAPTTDVTVRWSDGRTTEHRDLAPGPTHVLH